MATNIQSIRSCLEESKRYVLEALDKLDLLHTLSPVNDVELDMYNKTIVVLHELEHNLEYTQSILDLLHTLSSVDDKELEMYKRTKDIEKGM